MTKKHDKRDDKLQGEVDELTVQLKRALADYQNLQRRVADERAMVGKFATQAVLLEFLPVVEQLEQAVTTAPDTEKQSAWFVAVDISVKQLKDVMKKEGVAEINPIGELFNPEEHEVVDVAEGDEDNKIIEVFQKGYRLNDKVIVAAKVRVSKKGAPEHE